MAQRTWFITGVSSGFGRELAEQILQQGDRLVGTVRSTGKVTDLMAKYPETFRAELLDVTDTAAIREVVGRAFPGNSMYHATPRLNSPLRPTSRPGNDFDRNHPRKAVNP